ncbi:MAG: hypothetical protein NT080_05530 [Spirochaetes bacterium]|nr:hypothetical protein [Spirochaetota bacterium]
MKQHASRAIILSIAILVLFASGQVFADENTVNLESVVVQNFDTPDEQPWFVLGSKFATAEFPKIAFVNTWPVSLHGSNPKDKDTLKVLGVSMLFDRMEYNWVDVIPGKKTGNGADVKYEPIELPLPGRVAMLDMWVWSANFEYYMEVFVRDYKGIVHTIPFGNLSFVGWKNIRANVPTNIQQAKKYIPATENLTLVKFRIWTRPTERVAMPVPFEAPAYQKAIYFYFDNLKVLTDTYDTLYDGDELVRDDVLKQNWDTGSQGGK